jgi:hypothetical protein
VAVRPIRRTATNAVCRRPTRQSIWKPEARAMSSIQVSFDCGTAASVVELSFTDQDSMSQHTTTSLFRRLAWQSTIPVEVRLAGDIAGSDVYYVSQRPQSC